MTGLCIAKYTKLNFKNGEWLFFKANDMTYRRQLQLKKDIVFISEIFSYLYPLECIHLL